MLEMRKPMYEYKFIEIPIDKDDGMREMDKLERQGWKLLYMTPFYNTDGVMYWKKATVALRRKLKK